MSEEPLSPILDKPLEVKTSLPKDCDYNFAIWMSTNNYARNTLKNYHTQVRSMINKQYYISPEKIKAFLSVKNTLTKRASIKLFLVYLDDVLNIRIQSFRYPRLKKETKALKVISQESYDKIYSCMRPEFKLFMEVMYTAGLRLSECVNIRTEWFNWVEWFDNQEEYGQLTILKSKRNKDRIIPINPELMKKIYDVCPRHDDGALKKWILFDHRYKLYIYRKKRFKGCTEEIAHARYVDKVSRFFQVSIAEASMKALGYKIKSHSLRATRATNLDEKGLRGSTIRDFLGHDNLSTTSRYIINTPEKMKEEIKRADG
jgi:integrase